MKNRVTDPSHLLFDHIEYDRMCKGKKKYSSPWDANYTISLSKDKSKLSYYKCPYCNNYHLTSN